MDLFGDGENRYIGDTTAESVRYKLLKYLLDLTHEDGWSKAEWFKRALGFTRTNADALAEQIVFDPQRAIEDGVNKQGVKYRQYIDIIGANGKTMGVKFIWIMNDDGVVRLVTAIPSKRGGKSGMEIL